MQHILINDTSDWEVNLEYCYLPSFLYLAVIGGYWRMGNEGLMQILFEL